MIIATRILGVIGVACVAALLPFWMRMLVSPAPQELREGAMLLSTMAWLDGRNPYALASLPTTVNLYGPLYPLMTVPLAALFGPTLFVHRLVDGLGMLAACATLFVVLRRAGVPRIAAQGGAALNLAGLLYWVGPASRPDGLGMALMVGALAVLAPAPGASRRFAIGLLLSLLGFATKAYYVLPVFVAAAWVLLFADRKRGAALLVTAAGALVLGMLGLSEIFPAWAPTVLGANLDATRYSFAHLLRQSKDWALFSLPLLAAALASLLTRTPAPEPEARSLEPPRPPVPEPGAWSPKPAVDLWSLALVVGIVAVLVSLGGHPGAHMTYLFHLISPPLTVVVLRAAVRRPFAGLTFAAFLPVAAALNAHWFSFDLDRLRRAEATFAHASAIIRAATNPTGTAEFTPLLAAAGRIPIETGHSEYFRAVAPPVWLAPLWPDRAALDARARAMVDDLWQSIETQRFDVVIANRRDLGLFTTAHLATRYRKVETLDLDMWWAGQRWPGDVWVPGEQASGSGLRAPGLEP